MRNLFFSGTDTRRQERQGLRLLAREDVLPPIRGKLHDPFAEFVDPRIGNHFCVIPNASVQGLFYADDIRLDNRRIRHLQRFGDFLQDIVVVRPALANLVIRFVRPLVLHPKHPPHQRQRALDKDGLALRNRRNRAKHEDCRRAFSQILNRCLLICRRDAAHARQVDKDDSILQKGVLHNDLNVGNALLISWVLLLVYIVRQALFRTLDLAPLTRRKNDEGLRIFISPIAHGGWDASRLIRIHRQQNVTEQNGIQEGTFPRPLRSEHGNQALLRTQVSHTFCKPLVYIRSIQILAKCGLNLLVRIELFYVHAFYRFHFCGFTPSRELRYKRHAFLTHFLDTFLTAPAFDWPFEINLP